MKLITVPDSRLNQKCDPCPPLHFKTVLDAFMLLRELKGLGLAAPQMGIGERWFVTAWGELFVNPTIEAATGYLISMEGCLSIPGKRFLVERSDEVVVLGRRYTGDQAIVIQHELDHLDGILISDKGVPA